MFSVAILLYCIHGAGDEFTHTNTRDQGTKMMTRLNKLTSLECLGTDAHLYKPGNINAGRRARRVGIEAARV